MSTRAKTLVQKPSVLDQPPLELAAQLLELKSEPDETLSRQAPAWLTLQLLHFARRMKIRNVRCSRTERV